MTIIRAERPHINYTIIKNETLRNNSLSFRARGIHAYLLSMPDNWRTSALQMSRQGQEGRDAILKALQELEDAGFVKRTKSQDPRGRWHLPLKYSLSGPTPLGRFLFQEFTHVRSH
jgi:DNA-binding MarR family transcriptional regulator